MEMLRKTKVSNVAKAPLGVLAVFSQSVCVLFAGGGLPVV